jgi:hypothetical protein
MVIKKTALILTTLLIANTNIALADSYLKEEKTTNFIVTPSVAYRYDVFRWSIPRSQFNKKLSELIWKNHIVQPGIKIETKPKANSFTFLGQAKHGYILKNPSKSWDYDWYNTEEESEPYSKTKSAVKGNILDLSGAIGYSLNLFNNNLFTFYLGYDYTDYRIKDYGCRQLAYNQNRLLYPFNQLIEKYNFKTKSPWLGLSFNVPLNDKFLIIPTIRLYSFKYIGKGYWLLRNDLKQNPSFKHNVKGIGLGFDMDFLYKYSDRLDFKINLETKEFKMKTGKDQLFYSAKDIGGERVSIGKLYNLNLISSSITAGFRYKL